MTSVQPTSEARRLRNASGGAAWRHAATLAAAVLFATTPLVACAKPGIYVQTANVENRLAPISMVQLDHDPIQLVPAKDMNLRFAWAARVSAPDRGVTRFVDYAFQFSRLRLSDGRALAVAINRETGAQVSLRAARMYNADEEYDDLEAIYTQPEHPPNIEGYTFVDGFGVGGSAGSQGFIGIWADEKGRAVLAAFDDEQDPARSPTILASLSGDVQVVSGIAPIHGGPTTIALATQPNANGQFDIVAYDWHR